MRCAVCWRPHKGSKMRGTVESNELCTKCKRSRANRDWVETPKEEVSIGLLHDDVFLARQAERDERVRDDSRALTEPESGCSRYESSQAVNVIKLYCMRVPQRKIAADTGVSLSFVNRTVAHWKRNFGNLLKDLRRMLA